MARGEVDQAAVEILDLDAQLVDLADDGGQLGSGTCDRLLELADAARIEAAAVPGNVRLHLLELRAELDVRPSLLDEALHERTHDGKRAVRLVWREELHLRHS